MNIQNSVKRIMRNYGSSIKVVCNTKTQNVRGFIEPLRYKNKMYISGATLPNGFFDGGHYLYVGVPDVIFGDNYRDVVIHDKHKSYIIKRAENYMVNDQIVYVWAILTPYIKPMEDDYESS